MQTVRVAWLGFLVPAVCTSCAFRTDADALRHHALLRDDLHLRKARSISVPSPLSVEAAIRLAWEHNLERALLQQERAIEKEKATGEMLKMLPAVRVRLDESYRNELAASSSESVDTGQESLEPSRSSEQHARRTSVGFTWELVDFGLSYLGARQSARRVDILTQRLDRMRQRLALDVTRAYWQLAIASVAQARAEHVLTEAREREARLQEQIEQKTLSDTDALEQQKQLLRMEWTLSVYQGRVAETRTRLAELIGLAPGTAFVLPDPPEVTTISEPVCALPQLETEALQNRPELREQDLHERIAIQDVRASLMRICPTLDLYGRRHYDDNPYLYKQYWNTVGVDVAWNLLALPRRILEWKAAKADVELVRIRRVLLAQGILTQVHLAAVDLEAAYRRARLTERMFRVQERLLAALRKREREVGARAVFNAQVDTLLARVRHMNAHAEYMVAGARLDNALGRSPGERKEPGGAVAQARPQPPHDAAAAQPTAQADSRADAPGPKRSLRTTTLAFPAANADRSRRPASTDTEDLRACAAPGRDAARAFEAAELLW